MGTQGKQTPSKELQITEAMIAELPKTDLHVHLDGSIRLGTLIELAQAHGISLPSYTESGLRELVFKPEYASLAEYLKGFEYTVGVLQSEEALERCAYELACDNQDEGVCYLEVRFAPQLHVHENLDTVAVLQAVNRGLQRARDAYNSRQDVRDEAKPPFEYGIICCALRKFKVGFSSYYTQLLHSHRYTPEKEVYRMASMELARAAVHARDALDLPIVGFDLAGEEAGYPPGDHVDAFLFAHRHFLKKTVHAGEAYGPESVFQAITQTLADRIGHGTSLLDPSALSDPSIEDPKLYIDRLSQFIADRRITLEICLSSNLQTHPQMKSIAEHPFKQMRAQRLSTTLCTDNRTISNTTVTQECALAVKHLGVTAYDLKSIIIYGFKRSFFPGPYAVKRRYVRRVIDHYEAVERRHLGVNVKS